MHLSKLRSQAILGLAFCAVTTFAVAQAPNTLAVTSGTTDLTLSQSFISTLGSSTLTATAITPSELHGDHINFPVVAGAADLNTLEGVIEHNGGITVTSGDNSIAFLDLNLRSGGGGEVTAIVITNGVFNGRQHVGNILQGTSGTATNGYTPVIRYDGAPIVLATNGAALLNSALGTTAFKPNAQIGTANILAIAAPSSSKY